MCLHRWVPFFVCFSLFFLHSSIFLKLCSMSRLLMLILSSQHELWLLILNKWIINLRNNELDLDCFICTLQHSRGQDIRNVLNREGRGTHPVTCSQIPDSFVFQPMNRSTSRKGLLIDHFWFVRGNGGPGVFLHGHERSLLLSAHSASAKPRPKFCEKASTRGLLAVPATPSSVASQASKW